MTDAAEQIIETLFRLLLGRATDPGGREHFSAMIRSGISSDEVGQCIAASEEFKLAGGLAAVAARLGQLEPKVLSSRDAFAIAFGRDPSSEEMGRLRHFQIDETGPALSQLRAVGAAFETYTHPTTLSIRFCPEDLVTVQCDGFRFIADRYDFAVARTVITTCGFESHVTNAIRRFLRPGMSAIDIGANVGFQTMHMASAVGAEGKVIAVEPSSENCRLIMLNATANAFNHIEVQPFALSDAPGLALLSRSIGSNGVIMPTGAANPGCTVAPRTTLDQIVAGRSVDFIKIDVEGSEFRVMSGARETLERCRPVIVSELSPTMISTFSGDSAADYLSMIARIGYSVHLIDRKEGTIGPEVRPGQLLAEWGSASRIEDVAFVPRQPTGAISHL